MDQITKFLLKLSKKEKDMLLEILQHILALDLDNLDVKKLQGEWDLFRVRKGKIRIIFKKTAWQGEIIDINYRGNIYDKL